MDQAANRIREEVAEDANIIFGSAIDTSLNGKICVSVVATGIDNPPAGRATTQPAEAAAPATPAQPAPEAAAAPVAPATAQAAPQQPAAQQPAAPARPGHAPAHGAAQRPPAAPRAPSPHAVPPQVQRSSPRSPLFTENARAQAPEPQAAPRSLFGIVTGALRRHSTPPQPEAPQPQRTEPSVQQQPMAQPSAPPAPGNATPPEDGGLDIPAFLRRRSN